MAQLERETLDLKSQLQSSGFKLTIHPGHMLIGSEPLNLATYDISGLKNILAECRRLKELTGVVNDLSSERYTESNHQKSSLKRHHPPKRFLGSQIIPRAGAGMSIYLLVS